MNEIFQEILSDFKKVGDVEESVIKKYEGVLADDIIKLWKEYGYGTFYHGFMKIVNPDEYMEIYGKLVENVTGEKKTLCIYHMKKQFENMVSRNIINVLGIHLYCVLEDVKRLIRWKKLI